MNEWATHLEMISMDKWLRGNGNIEEMEWIEADAIKYSNEIAMVLKAKSKGPNRQRMLLAKVFIEIVKKEMLHWLVSGGVFGSTSRGEAKKKSDVDVLLFLQPLTSEEKRIQNALDIVQSRRFLEFNIANNSYRIAELASVFTEKTGIEVSPFEYYIQDQEEWKGRFKPIMILE